MLASIVNNDNDFVLASVTGRFGDEFISHLKSAIYIEVPREIRLKRVYERSYALFGEKCREGGVFYEHVKSFHEFCELRDEKTVEHWLSTVSCPIVRVDGTLPIDDNVELIVQKL